MYKHILIPTDGSPLANKGAKAGIALARKLGAKVTGFCAIEELQPIYVEGYAFNQKEIDIFEQRTLEAAQKRVAAIGGLAKAAGVPFTAAVTTDATPYEGIVAIAKKRKCDLIFMASHGRNGISRLIMGSVTQKVLAHTKLAVMVYR
jgi:nucleotide-binding universal stress UspA family protein